MQEAPLGRGERAPDFVLPRGDGTPTRFYAIAGGRPTALVFAGADGSEAAIRLGDALADSEVGVHIVTRTSPHAGSDVLADAEGEVHARYRVAGGTPTVVVLDPNLRVLGAVALADADAASRVRELTASIAPTGDDVEVAAQAPVLLVPDVLDQGWCARLIDVWETGGNVETGVEASGEGRRAEVLSTHKQRRDHTVADAGLMRELVATVGRRVMPEVHKAFAYRATRFEGFKIACYDASTGGFFRAHRDNLSPSTAHRRFALTLNLNAGYDGGQLRFPEYGPQRYRPRAGEALVFSCSHLHEVLDVTAGRRWVLLSFLFGEDAVRSSAEPGRSPSSG